MLNDADNCENREYTKRKNPLGPATHTHKPGKKIGCLSYIKLKE